MPKYWDMNANVSQVPIEWMFGKEKMTDIFKGSSGGHLRKISSIFFCDSFVFSNTHTMAN